LNRLSIESIKLRSRQGHRRAGARKAEQAVNRDGLKCPLAVKLRGRELFSERSERGGYALRRLLEDAEHYHQPSHLLIALDQTYGRNAGEGQNQGQVKFGHGMKG
jgi:hypothetical protein